MMEVLITVAAIVQAITTCVIMYITYRYTQFTKVMLEASIDPFIEVHFCGNMRRNGIMVENDSGCLVNDLEVWVYVGFKKGEEVYDVKKGLGRWSWAVLKPGARVQTEVSCISWDMILEADREQPDGVEVDLNDVFIEYSFVREADKQRYCYRSQVRVMRDEDRLPDIKAWIVFAGCKEPERARNFKKVFLKRRSGRVDRVDKEG